MEKGVSGKTSDISSTRLLPLTAYHWPPPRRLAMQEPPETLCDVAVLLEAERRLELDTAGVLDAGRRHEIRRAHVARVTLTHDSIERILRAHRELHLEARIAAVVEIVVVATAALKATAAEALLVAAAITTAGIALRLTTPGIAGAGATKSDRLVERELRDVPGRVAAQRVAADALGTIVDDAVTVVVGTGGHVVGRCRAELQVTLQTEIVWQPDHAADLPLMPDVLTLRSPVGAGIEAVRRQ